MEKCSVGEFWKVRIGKNTTIKSFSYKNVLSHFFSGIAVTTIGFFLL